MVVLIIEGDEVRKYDFYGRGSETWCIYANRLTKAPSTSEELRTKTTTRHRWEIQMRVLEEERMILSQRKNSSFVRAVYCGQASGQPRTDGLWKIRPVCIPCTLVAELLNGATPNTHTHCASAPNRASPRSTIQHQLRIKPE